MSTIKRSSHRPTYPGSIVFLSRHDDNKEPLVFRNASAAIKAVAPIVGNETRRKTMLRLCKLLVERLRPVRLERLE